MKIEEIKKYTLSTGCSTKSTVYRARRNTIIVGDIDGDGDRDFQEIEKGALAVISGCGSKHEGHYSKFMIGDVWCDGVNDDWEHYANTIGIKMD